MKHNIFFGSKILMTTIGMMFLFEMPVHAQTVVDVELSLLIDGSVSVSSIFDDQIDAYFNIFNSDDLFNNVISKGENSSIAVNLVQFGGTVREEIEFSLIDSVEDSKIFANKILSISQISGGTNIADGILLASNTLENNSYEGIEIIDVFSDGIIGSSPSLAEARNQALSEVDRINAIGIGSDAVLSSLEDFVIGGEDSFAVVAENFETDFESVLENKIITEISTDNGITPQPINIPEPKQIISLIAIGVFGIFSKRGNKK